jgi:hypothetical protein
MDVRRRIGQFLMVVAMATAGTAFTTADASAASGSEWCANSCGAMWVCDGAGGRCEPELCLGIDLEWYDYTIYCNES